MSELTFYEKISNIQVNLDVPKSQRNTFGNYNYRSCEDILMALKPFLEKHKLFLTLSDSIELVGDRYYVVATARISDGVNSLENQARAREEVSKKGMDSAQLTGATSSYSRKYSLAGLFGIDDEKDSDATNKHDNQPSKNESTSISSTNDPSEKQMKMIFAITKNLYPNMTNEEINKRMESIKTSRQASEAIEKLQAEQKKRG